VLFEPLDFIARLAALVPKPRVNLTRYHGVFAPNSAHRAQVTKAHRGKGARGQAAAATDDRPRGRSADAGRVAASSPRFCSVAAVDSRPEQAIGCAQGVRRCASRRGRAGLAAAEVVAAAISATEAGPTGLRCGFCSPKPTGAGRPKDEEGALSGLYSHRGTLHWPSSPYTTVNCPEAGPLSPFQALRAHPIPRLEPSRDT
jgi:hypothetical protein